MNVVVLSKAHNRKFFECEEPALTRYLCEQASQDMERKLAVCFVAADEQLQVRGYYTLTSESLGRESIPERFGKRLPKGYNAPVILLGRLARHSEERGRGLGEFLLIDALWRAYTLSVESLGALAVVVDPMHDRAAHFYRSFGFMDLPDSGRMFLPMAVIKKLF